MELLISIVLIGIVLVFLFQLLVDLKNETKNNDFAFNNQVNRAEVINTIQKDLDRYLLVGIKSVSADSINLNFEFKIGAEIKIANLLADDKSISYINADGEKYKWQMKDASISQCADFLINRHWDSDKYYFKINIKVYNEHMNNSEDRNNPIDDIEITYAGYQKNLISDIDYITEYSTDEQIGKCS